MPGKVAEVNGSPLIHIAINKLNDKLYDNLISTAGESSSQTVIGDTEYPH
jgi:hypothetical protein